MNKEALYRGISKEKFARDGDILKSRVYGPFEKELTLDYELLDNEDETFDLTLDDENFESLDQDSEINATLTHNYNRSDTTPGISTSLSFETAKKYALSKHDSGFVFEFSINKLIDENFHLIDVNKKLKKPNKHEDEEFIICIESNEKEKLLNTLISNIHTVSK